MRNKSNEYVKRARSRLFEELEENLRCSSGVDTGTVSLMFHTRISRAVVHVKRIAVVLASQR